MATPFVVDSRTGAATSNVTSWDVTLPLHLPGDLLFVLTTRNLNQGIAPPPDWTVLADVAVGSSDRMMVAYKMALVQEESATFTAGTGERCVWVAFSVRNHNHVNAVAIASSGSSSTPSFPSVTSTVDNALILTFLSARLETTPHTQPNGYTEIAETSYASAGSASAAWMVKAQAGSETPGNATMNSSAAWGTFTLAVAPGGRTRSYRLSPQKDTRIISGSTYMNLNFGANDRLGIGEHRAAVQTQRTLMQFETLSTLSPSMPVSSCKFSFVLNTDQSDNDSTYSIYRLKRSWVEGTQNGSGTPNGATWNTYDGVNAWTSAGAFDSADCEQTALVSFNISASATPGTRIEVDLSSIVSTVGDLDLGYGWLIKADTENNLWEINSNEYATVTDRPELFFLEPPVPGQEYRDIFIASESWTCPAGVTTVTVEAWGGGGNGSSGYVSSVLYAGGGGGGGAYAKGDVAVTPGNSYTLTVGGAGQDSSFTGDSSQQVLADGGGHGSTDSFALGGQAGLASASVGTVKYDGGGGGNGTSTAASGGGGGASSAGRFQAGIAGVSSVGGSANGRQGGNAPYGGGDGGNGGTYNVSGGVAGVIPGGGGGGAPSSSNAYGLGAQGVITLTYIVAASLSMVMHHRRMLSRG